MQLFSSALLIYVSSEAEGLAELLSCVCPVGSWQRHQRQHAR